MSPLFLTWYNGPGVSSTARDRSSEGQLGWNWTNPPLVNKNTFWWFCRTIHTDSAIYYRLSFQNVSALSARSNISALSENVSIIWTCQRCSKRVCLYYWGNLLIFFEKKNSNYIKQVYMYNVAKLAPSSQVASKRGLTTFNSLSLSSQNGKTKLF